MNILMVNPVHPATPHISGVRAWRFAKELAASGHRVALLTAPLAGQVATAALRIEGHDWRTPLVLECCHDATAGEVRALPTLLRKVMTAWRLLRHGGEMMGWASSAVATAQRLRECFAPEVVWCTFGKLEAVVVARRIARQARCPWVLDIKDNWELYVPAGMRRLMAWRTRGWHAVTANAQFTADKARLWQGTEATVVYSGVDEAFYFRDAEPANPADIFRINLIGGIYFRDALEILVEGLETWASGVRHAAPASLTLHYLGGDGARFDEAVRGRLHAFTVVNEGYRDIGVMAQACRSAALNVYVAHSGTFHHKLLELLSCGRPVMAIPEESDESRWLAARDGGVLIEAADARQIAAGLQQVCHSWRQNAGARGCAPAADRRYSWQSQARELERVLERVVAHQGTTNGA
jgi:glycosyltransferase involved in cell wall biosynthesis